MVSPLMTNRQKSTTNTINNNNIINSYIQSTHATIYLLGYYNDNLVLDYSKIEGNSVTV